MSDWGVTPEYILNNWTEAKLALMLQKRAERIRLINESMKPLEEPKAKRVPIERLMGTAYRKVS